MSERRKDFVPGSRCLVCDRQLDRDIPIDVRGGHAPDCLTIPVEERRHCRIGKVWTKTDAGKVLATTTAWAMPEYLLRRVMEIQIDRHRHPTAVPGTSNTPVSVRDHLREGWFA